MLSDEDGLFGKVAIDLNVITATQLEKAVADLKNYPGKKIGEYLVEKGILYPWDIEEILNAQQRIKKEKELEKRPAIAPSKDKEIQEKKVTPVPVSPKPPPLVSEQAPVAPQPPSLKENKVFQKPVPMPEPEAVLEKPSPPAAVPAVEEASAESFQSVSFAIHEGLKNLLVKARNMGASDLHICAGSKPFIRKFKKIHFLDEPELTAEDTEALVFGSISEAQKRSLIQNKSLDFCLAPDGIGRYRTCLYKQIKGWEAVFRIIPDKIKTFEDLALPPVLRKLTEYHQGLILITGPSGSGKSTTLAAMLDLINRERSDHIITVEDPIEYILMPQNCQITQRELRNHTLSFSNALKAALREDPDIVMIGEMRDRETMSMAISASETGHLVLGTMPTSSAARTINSVVDFFPSDQQGQIRSMISESLRGIICQQLLTHPSGDGVELALEVLLFDAGVSAIIRQNQLHQLASVMQTGKGKGMMTMDDSLFQLAKEGRIVGEEAYLLCENKARFEPFRKKGE